MLLRESTFNDLPEIMNIINQARAYLKQNRIDQWQNGYPDQNDIRSDIERDNSYVLVAEEVLAGTAAVSFDGEKTYNYIKGRWLTTGNYGTVHRLAVSSAYRNTGAAGIMMKHIEQLSIENKAQSIRIDTHDENKAMRRFLEKCGFKYCGIIYLEDGSKRLAYEKLIC
jgi:ribosomal protein S18 acetylase RimI-like enzyme